MVDLVILALVLALVVDRCWVLWLQRFANIQTTKIIAADLVMGDWIKRNARTAGVKVTSVSDAAAVDLLPAVDPDLVEFPKNFGGVV